MKQKADNRGLTLVELLIAIAITSVAAVAIFGFIVVGARSFSSTSSDINIQHEAQLVFNQLQDLLVDTAIGVDYMYSDSAETDKIVSTDADIPASATEKKLIMYNYDPDDESKHVYEVVWNVAESRLYYSEYLPLLSVDGSGNSTVSRGSVVHSMQLMGENIVDFAVDLSDMESKRIVRVDFEFLKGTKEYRSSHNITLRNQIARGSEIPAYVEAGNTNDPEKVVGLENLYVEPGDVIDMNAVGGYKVLAVGGGDYPDQDMRFFMSNTAPFEPGTSMSTEGILTVSKAQKTDFYVVVMTRSGKGAFLTVKVNMIIVESVDISFAKSESAENELNASVEKYEDDLAGGETFTLTATVKGRNLDKAKAGVNMYAVDWAIGRNDADTESANYVTMGTPVATATGSTCEFTMKDNFDTDDTTGTAPFVIRATAVRSTQIPYYVGNTPTPVVGYFTGTAYRQPSDFTITIKGGLIRGKHDTGRVDALYNELYQIVGFNSNDYTVIADVNINELEYHQDNNHPSQTYTRYNNISYVGEPYKGEGDHLGIWAPDLTASNPNSEYEFEVTFYVLKRAPGDNTNWGTIRVFDYDDTYTENGYTYSTSDYVYKSNTATKRSNRVNIFYGPLTEDYWDNEGNHIKSGEWTASATPRVFSKFYGGEGDSWNANTEVWIPINECTAVEDNGVKNTMGNRDSFRMYYKKDGTWIEYDSSRQITGDSKYSAVTDFLTARYENNSLRINYKNEAWNDDVPSVIRVVPNVLYTQSDGRGDSDEKEAILFDNYVDVYLWNIEVPTVLPDIQNGFDKSTGWFSSTEYTRLYFPCPADADFTTLVENTTAGYKTWVYPYPTNAKDAYGNSDGNKNAQISKLKLKYMLRYNADGDGNKTWYLHLRDASGVANSKFKETTYSIASNGRMWEEVEEAPDNLKADFGITN